jgi:hypothetical protein
MLYISLLLAEYGASANGNKDILSPTKKQPTPLSKLYSLIFKQTRNSSFISSLMGIKTFDYRKRFLH